MENMNENSINETANSIHLEHDERDKEMAVINSRLLRFIKEELEVDLKFDSLDEHPLITNLPHLLLKPVPQIYCLAHGILLT